MIGKVSVFKICVTAFFIYICYFLISFNLFFSKLNFSNYNLLRDLDKYFLNNQTQSEACDYNCSYNCTIQNFKTKELFEQCNTKCKCILIYDNTHDNAISSKFTIIFILMLVTYYLSYQSGSSSQIIKSKSKITDDEFNSEFNEYKEALI